MHKCLKCGRIASSISEISEGCACGSKVFIFSRLEEGQKISQPLAVQNNEIKGGKIDLENAGKAGQQAQGNGQKIAVGDEEISASAPSVASAIISSDEPDDPAKAYSEVWLSKGGRVEAMDKPIPVQSVGENPLPNKGADLVANVRQIQSGVYEIDVSRISSEPLVIQDFQGVYYVRLPFVPLGENDTFFAPKSKNQA